MTVQLKVDDNTYQEKLLTLNGNSLFITYSYNTRDNRWYFDIVDRNDIDIISGVKILPDQNLTGKYLDVNNLLNGNIYCVNTRLDGTDITRDNFGTDKKFQLWYLTSEEEADIGV